MTTDHAAALERLCIAALWAIASFTALFVIYAGSRMAAPWIEATMKGLF